MITAPARSQEPAMRCRFCGCRCAEERIPRDWKVCGGLALCRECLRTRCRVRTITSSVAETACAGWHEFCAVLQNESQPLPIRDRDRIELTSAANGPAVRVFLTDRWWTLRLNSNGWSVGRRADYCKMLAGEIFALEVLLYRGMARGTHLQNGFARKRPGEAIVCKITAWLPGRRRAEVSPFDSGVPDRQDIASMDLNKLRRAIRANRVSFPAQLPAFPGGAHDTDLQRRAAQLYFVLGWSCAGIAARYSLLPREARRMVTVWKQRAANAGYIQHIPPLTAIGQSAGGDPSLPANSGPEADSDSTSEDGRLISGLRAGDRSAYDRLLERYQDPVYNLAARLLCDRANADEVTQTVFLNAFRAVSDLCHIGSVRTWLYRFVVTECLKRCPGQSLAAAPASRVPIERALLEIDPVFRTALVLREIENLGYEEIAEILQLPLGTVQCRIELGRNQLRQNLITSVNARGAAASTIPAHSAGDLRAAQLS